MHPQQLLKAYNVTLKLIIIKKSWGKKKRAKMAPDVIQFHPTLAPLQFSPLLTLKQRSSQRDHQGMNLTNKKKLVPILLLILSIISILMLLSLILRSSSSAMSPPSSPLFSTHNKSCITCTWVLKAPQFHPNWKRVQSSLKPCCS